MNPFYVCQIHKEQASSSQLIMLCHGSTVFFIVNIKTKFDKHGKSQLHIYFKPLNLNQPVAREPFYCRTHDDIFHKLSQEKCSLLYISARELITLNLTKPTHFSKYFYVPSGRFRFTRMPSGLIDAGNAFWCTIGTIFHNVDFCMGMADDMIICSKQTNSSDYDKPLTEFLQATRQQNLKLN